MDIAQSLTPDTEKCDDNHFSKVTDQIQDTIRVNYTFLLDQIDIDRGLLDEAYQDGILEFDDTERVRNEPTQQARTRKFLDVLRCKHRTARVIFLKILKSKQPHIHRKLADYRPTPFSTSSVSETFKEEETLIGFLKMCAESSLEYDTDDPKAVLPLLQVHSTFQQELDRSGLGDYHGLKDEDVVRVIKDVFPNVHIDIWETTHKRKEKRKKKQQTSGTSKVHGVRWRNKGKRRNKELQIPGEAEMIPKQISPPSTRSESTRTSPIGQEASGIETVPKTICYERTMVTRTSSSTEGSTDSDHETVPKETPWTSKRTSITHWSSDEVCQFLSSIGLGEAITDTFRQEDVSGEVFETMNRSEMKEILPSAKFGPLKKIVIARDKLLEGAYDVKTEANRTSTTDPKCRQSKETPRKFESEVVASTKYRKGHFLPDANKHLGDPLERVSMYCSLRDASRESVELFKRQAMEFASACLNERTNGTIYFGIEEAGQIVGVPGDTALWRTALGSGIKTFFYPDDLDQVMKCILPLRMVEVLDRSTREATLHHVLEVDILPVFVICKDNAFFIKDTIENSSSREPRLMRYKNGELKSIHGYELCQFMKAKGDMSLNRKQREADRQKESSKSTENLGQKLKQLLCQGEETLDGDIFPVLVTTAFPENATDSDNVRNYQFIKDLPWKVVFDFDDGEGLYKYLDQTEEQVLKVITSEDFDQSSEENKKKPDRLHGLLQDLKSSSHRPWIFSNGYTALDAAPQSVRKWKQTRSEGFKEAVRFIKNEIPKGRAIVVFMLFSKEYEVMLEAADEIVQKFGNQWFTLAESSEISEAWQDGLLRRNLVDDKKDLDEKSVIGMPWNHVNDTVSSILQTVRDGTCELPTSTGSLVALPERMKNDWIDLDIVGVKHCKPENIHKNDDDSALNTYNSDVAAKFYRGEEVDWWNFYFKDHVLERGCLNAIVESVRDTLSGKNDEEDRVACVHLYHQPGAGGTTTAKHVIWKLKEQYRCAVVKKITNQTCDQITKFHIFEDEKPKPILLMFDNIDDEKTTELRAELEERAKQISRHNLDNPCPIFYVFLLCTRNTKLPNNKGSKYFLLKHALQIDEQNWFRNKSEELRKKYEENAKSGVNPKHLISFNIMKENFNQTYIEKTVSDLLSEIKKENERLLLTYVSLLNAYDVSFQSIPASAFDAIMDDSQSHAPWLTSGRYELHLSQPLSILLNQVNRKKQGEGHHIRIIHIALSRVIYDKLAVVEAKSGKKQPLSEMTMDFLDSGLFIMTYPDNAVEQLLKVVRDVVKKRAKNPQDGKPMTKFAPLIQEVTDDPEQGVDCAADVLERVYQLSGDVFVGQQLARVYIDAKNWEKARRYAKDITDKRSDNSFLWDTYGHSYREEIKEKYTECMQKCMTPNEAVDVVDLALKAIHIFQKEQEVSEVERIPYANNAGYFQELATVTSLFDCLSLVDGLQENVLLHKVLVQETSFPQAILNAFGEERVRRLYQLQDGVSKALARLEDEHLQLRDGMADEYRKSNLRRGKDMLIRYKENLENYYGEEEDDVPSNLSDEEACKYRRRRIFRLASGNTFRAVFELRRKECAVATLNTLKGLVDANMNSAFRDVFDLMMMLSINLTLCCIDQEQKNQIDRNEMARLSKQLYDLRENKTDSLEPYLFSTMFNWPQQTTFHKTAITAPELPAIIRNWKQAYFTKYPRQREEGKLYKKKETTLFFLGKGQGMDGLAFDKELRIGSGHKRNNEYFWRAANVVERLERWTGTLLHDGCEVKLTITQCGNKYTLTVPTSFPIMNRSWWNKPVFLVIGFTWAGPKAFDINIDDPTKFRRTAEHRVVSSHQMTAQHYSHQPRVESMMFRNTTMTQQREFRQRPDYLHYNNNIHFRNELQEVQGQIQKINNIRRKPRNKRTREEEYLLSQESRIKQQLDKIIAYRMQALNEFYAGY